MSIKKIYKSWLKETLEVMHEEWLEKHISKDGTLKERATAEIYVNLLEAKQTKWLQFSKRKKLRSHAKYVANCYWMIEDFDKIYKEIQKL